jgi:SAM-dependent methyltransferase
MSATELSFPDDSFDGAYSIHVTEHIEDVELHLSEVARVLRPGGRFVVVTPNRLTYSPDGPHNAFHVREYDAGELEALLTSFFPEVEITGLHAGLDLALRPEVQDYEFSARIKALRAALKDEELREFMEEWLVEDGFESFNAKAVGPHSFPISSKSINTSLDLLAACRKA